MSDTKKKYRVLCYGWCATDPGGRKCWIEYPPDRAAEEGAVIDDLPPLVVPDLIAQGLIEEVATQDENGEGGES